MQASSIIVTTNPTSDQNLEKSYLKFQQEPVTDGEQHLIIIDSPDEQVSFVIYFQRKYTSKQFYLPSVFLLKSSPLQYIYLSDNILLAFSSRKPRLCSIITAKLSVIETVCLTQFQNFPFHILPLIHSQSHSYTQFQFSYFSSFYYQLQRGSRRVTLFNNAEENPRSKCNLQLFQVRNVARFKSAILSTRVKKQEFRKTHLQNISRHSSM